MRTLLRWTIRLLFIAAVAVAISAIINMKREWELLSENEIRDRLGEKLEGRVSDEQLGQIQDRIVTFLKRNGPVSYDRAVAQAQGGDTE